MSLQAPVTKLNPLTAYMRQPKIYIKLPSGGSFWAPRSIEIPENGELPIYSMTAKDELLFKTPDALLNGQSIVDVIQSCVPSIKNAWMMPTIDLDTLLIAIRIATYGDKMPFSVKVPVVNEDLEFEVDLRQLLDQQFNTVTWDEVVNISDEMAVLVKPLTYKHMTQVSIKSFETQRILDMVNDDSISDEKKLEIFNGSFSNLTQVTVDLLADSISKIVIAEAEVTDPKHIKDFISNADKDIFAAIKAHIDQLKKINELKPFEIATTLEQQAAGAPETFEVPLNFDNSNFFG
jgi:hypothetical protein